MTDKAKVKSVKPFIIAAVVLLCCAAVFVAASISTAKKKDERYELCRDRAKRIFEAANEYKSAYSNHPVFMGSDEKIYSRDELTESLSGVLTANGKSEEPTNITITVDRLFTDAEGGKWAVKLVDGQIIEAFYTDGDSTSLIGGVTVIGRYPEPIDTDNPQYTDWDEVIAYIEAE